MKKAQAVGPSPCQREFFFVVSSQPTRGEEDRSGLLETNSPSQGVEALEREEAEMLRERLISELHEFGC